MKIYLYPCHSDEDFIICDEAAMQLMKKANPDEGPWLPGSKEFKQLKTNLGELLHIIKVRLADEPEAVKALKSMGGVLDPTIECIEEMDSIHLSLSLTGSEPVDFKDWHTAATKAVLAYFLNFVFTDVEYGSEDHKIWSKYIGD